MPRRFTVSILAAFMLLAMSVPALAKEGAVTKLDPGTPTSWYSGQTYSVGYMIRMDGVEPYKADKTEIVANSIDGKTSLVFPGAGDSTPGHYTAKVSFPAAGTYNWKVTQGSFFAAFDLGTISVLAPTANAGAAGAPAAPANEPLRDAMPFAAIGVALFATLVLARTQRRRIARAV